MRGYDSRTEALFLYVTPESYVPKNHPLRAIRAMADEALKDAKSGVHWTPNPEVTGH